MLQFEENHILADLRKAFARSKNEIVDLDERLGKKLESFIIRIEKLTHESGHQIPPHKQSRFSIIYICKGRGEKKIGTNSIPLKNNTLLVVPSQVTSSSEYKKGVRGYYLSVNLDWFLQKTFPWELVLKMDLFNPVVTPYFYLDETHGKTMVQIFETIFYELYNKKKNKEFLLSCKILELLLLCDRILKVEKNHPAHCQPLVMMQFIALIQEHFKKQHSVGFYARRLHMHPNSLNALARKNLRQSAKTTIDKKLINESKYLLRHTDFSVKQIAYELGFESASNFFRFFKRYSGSSPLAYRRSI